ncbi:uncharacterized protein LOC132060459 [Lycium ferocissimum]|uniref:uncharacterized protein LOC132060459 n=1 Tax=Lycium ferocissimum TaxID=112874 RepID=UPI00281627B9|nr:uncharacterized protein LOC132060459 [Lycium ferocissimum]
MEDRDDVLYSGPYTINNRPVITRAWSPNFSFKNKVLRTIPLWIRLPNLPMNCWGTETLSKIGSVLGCSLYADACTTELERVSYARILVEMDVNREMPMTVKVQDPSGKMMNKLLSMIGNQSIALSV